MLTRKTFKYACLLWLMMGYHAVTVKAQQDPSYTHFTYNKLLYNPAYAGASDNFCLNAINHQQWLGYRDKSPLIATQNPNFPATGQEIRGVNPRTTGVGFSLPIRIKIKEDKVNIGGAYAAFITDQIGYENSTYFRGGLAGAYNLPDGSSIRLGFEVTSLTKELDGKNLRYHDPNDPNIPSGKSSDSKINFGGGLYYINPNVLDGIWGGLSVTNIRPTIYQYATSGGAFVQTATTQHVYLIGGAKKEQFLGNPSLRLEPAFMLKSAIGENGGFIKPELDLQGMVTFNDLYAGGLNLRSYVLGLDALSIMLGYYPPIAGNGAGQQQTLRVGYSYDITLSNVRRTSFGTHEIQVNYCFNFSLPDRPPKIYRHPRWMVRDPLKD
jgi:type IX secretion system PorP/SprF family membrane protein